MGDDGWRFILATGDDGWRFLLATGDDGGRSPPPTVGSARKALHCRGKMKRQKYKIEVLCNMEAGRSELDI
ncbi:hypothetical protein EJB05_17000, partial [Eragrostis curvula]